MTTKLLSTLRRPFFWWVAFLSVFVAGGLYGAFQVFTRGLVVTNLSDLVPWGLWITIDLSAIALSAGAFTLSAAVYLLGLKQYQPVARTAVFVGLIGYSMACMMLLLDIGRPDRFWHGFVFWNVHSPLWEVTMCVGLYFTVLVLEVLPIFGRNEWVKAAMPGWARRLRSVHHIAPVLALAGLCLSMLHQSSLGATYGVLKARAFWYQPGLAVMFMVSALAAGPALTVLLSTLAGHLSPRAIVDKALLAKLTTFIGWVLAAYLYMRLWDVLSASYTYEAGRTEAWQMLLRGPMAVNFWVGELALGIVVPMILLLVAPFKRHEGYRTLALMLVVGGLVAYRWDINLAGQLIVAGQLPHVMVPQFTQYVPSLIEIMTGAGVVAYGLLAFSLGVNYLRVVEHVAEVADSAESPVRHPAPAVALTSS